MRASVCMATFNGEKYIRRQIESIISQLSQDDEIIISDHGSTDGTVEIIKEFKDSRIKLICKESHHIDRKSVIDRFRLVTQNFENALSAASGDYIFLSDQDDIWDKKKIEISLKYLQHCDLVVSNFGFIDENDSPIDLKVTYRKRSTQFRFESIGDTVYRLWYVFFKKSSETFSPVPEETLCT
jgi:glycosyltransferase involved in cell wall biosynthesis